MIKGIYIENFKGIGEPGIKLDLEPVTLLFGGNSAGKSSIFHAMLVAYEILVRGNRNPDQTELGGSAIDLGGFENFVHLHERTRTVRLRFDLDLSSVSLDQEWRIEERVVDFNWTSVDIGKAGEDVWSASVQIELSWDDIRNQAFVSKYVVELDEQPFAEIEDFRLIGGSVRMHVDPAHAVFRWADDKQTGSVGVLDHLLPGFRTPAEDLYLNADPVQLAGLEEILEDKEEFQDDAYDEDDHEFEMKFDAIRDRIEEEDQWEAEEDQRAGELNDADAEQHDVDEEDDFDDEEQAELDDLQGHGTIGRSGFIIELESLTQLRQTGEVEIRRVSHQDSSGRNFEAFLYRVDSGPVGVVAVRCVEEDGWLKQEAGEAVREWMEEVGFKDEDVDREAHTLMLSSVDALPNWHLPLEFQFAPPATTGDDTDVDRADIDYASELLSRLLIVPGRTLMNTLDACRYVGPLREIPSRQFVTPSTPDRSRWATGLAAWDFLATCSDDTLAEISHWLADKTRLGTYHEIVRRIFRELPSDSMEVLRLDSDDFLDEVERIRDAILARPEASRVQLYDKRLGVRIDPHDCAIGIAQLVPVVVAAVTLQADRQKTENPGVFMVEQPELHNHPTVEVGLGDLLISTLSERSSTCRFFVETHGQHLLLRMLRRIRETTAGTVDKSLRLQANRLAIYYLCRDQESGATLAKRIEVDVEGEFIQPWPDDFFEVDFKERFD